MSDFYLVTTDELTAAVVTLRLLAGTRPAEDLEGVILRAAATLAPRVGFAGNLVEPAPTPAPQSLRVPAFKAKADRLLAQRNAALEQRRDK